MTWYVVFSGRRPGVYRDWPTCHDQVAGFRNCSYKSYPSEDEAVNAYRAYLMLPGRSKPAPGAVPVEQRQLNVPPPNDDQWKDILIGMQFILILFLLYTMLFWSMYMAGTQSVHGRKVQNQEVTCPSAESPFLYSCHPFQRATFMVYVCLYLPVSKVCVRAPPLRCMLYTSFMYRKHTTMFICLFGVHVSQIVHNTSTLTRQCSIFKKGTLHNASQVLYY